METTSPVMSITDEQIAEIEALASKRNNAYGRHVVPDLNSTTLLALISRLRAAERDSARYRWLREHHNNESGQFEVIYPDHANGMSIEDFYGLDHQFDLDTAIDTAMKGERQ